MSRHVRSSRTLVALALIGLLAVAAGRWQPGAIGQEKTVSIKPGQVHQAEQLSAAFRHAAEVAMPSVVTIHSKKGHVVKHAKVNPHARHNGGENPFKGTPWEGFFNGQDMPGFSGHEMPHSEQPSEGIGSGVIVDSSGLVLTNNHVVEGADEVLVVLADGREFKAEDVKTDPESDLAVLSVKGAGSLPALPLGDSDDMRIGDWVLAIGNPFKLEQTVSAGIISGKGREISHSRMLQTDAAINPGNSGGPLVNLEGEVIGINTAIATNNGAFQGVGFVIPSNLAKWVMGQLVKNGSVERAYLGVALAPKDEAKEVAAILHTKNGEGVLISKVSPNSPAAEAGMQTGDLITEFNGTKVHSPSELRELVERVAIGSHQKLTVIRDGKSMTVDVTAKAMPGDYASSLERSAAPEETAETPPEYEEGNVGLAVSELSADMVKALGMKKAEGVVITKVEPDSVAAEKGLSEGLVVLKVGNHAVKSVEEFRAALKSESLDKGILMLVRTRNGGNHFVVLQKAAE
jgi:serine protease Do